MNLRLMGLQQSGCEGRPSNWGFEVRGFNLRALRQEPPQPRCGVGDVSASEFLTQSPLGRC